jgi:hypothetical protein
VDGVDFNELARCAEDVERHRLEMAADALSSEPLSR